MIENVEQVQALYKIRKKNIGTARNSGLSAEEAKKIKSYFKQSN